MLAYIHGFAPETTMEWRQRAEYSREYSLDLVNKQNNVTLTVQTNGEGFGMEVMFHHQNPPYPYADKDRSIKLRSTSPIDPADIADLSIERGEFHAQGYHKRSQTYPGYAGYTFGQFLKFSLV